MITLVYRRVCELAPIIAGLFCDAIVLARMTCCVARAKLSVDDAYTSGVVLVPSVKARDRDGNGLRDCDDVTNTEFANTAVLSV